MKGLKASQTLAVVRSDSTTPWPIELATTLSLMAEELSGRIWK